MEKDPFEYLPDVAFYALLTISELKFAAEFESVYRKKNPGVFEQASYFFAKELHLPVLTLTKMARDMTL
jgi:hypothetical protein